MMRETFYTLFVQSNVRIKLEQIFNTLILKNQILLYQSVSQFLL